MKEETVISKYTCEQALEDGVLVDVTEFNKSWKKGLFNFVTKSLLQEGYYNNEGHINLLNVVDLLNQCNKIVLNKSQNLTNIDTFYSGDIEFPNGETKTVFIAINGTGKFTLMLPTDY